MSFPVGSYITDNRHICRVNSILQVGAGERPIIYLTAPFQNKVIYRLRIFEIIKPHIDPNTSKTQYDRIVNDAFFQPYTDYVEDQIIANFTLLPSQEFYKQLYDGRV